MTGFLEEAPGVKSSTRLTMMVLLAYTAPVIAAIVYLALHRPVDVAGVAALGAVVITLVVHGAVAIQNRNGDSQEDHKDEH